MASQNYASRHLSHAELATICDQSRGLVKLDLRETGVDDASSPCLRALVRDASSLQALDLDGNQLTNDGVLTVARGLLERIDPPVVSFRGNPTTLPEGLPAEFQRVRQFLRFSLGISAPHRAQSGVFAFVRFRPDSGPADVAADDRHVLTFAGRQQAFDHVLLPGDSTQPCELVSGVASRAFQGFSAAILAYGGSGSGKTFTIDGLRRELTKSLADEAVRQQERCRADGSYFDANCKFALIECYNERLFDLTTNKEFKLRIVKDPLTEKHVLDAKGLSAKNINMTGPPEAVLGAAMDVVRSGELNRRTAATAMNDRSSRAHCIFRIEVDALHQAENGHTQKLSSTIFLVDLAGNENLKVHDDNATRRRRPSTTERLARELETKAINKSLLTLQQVVSFTADKPKRLSDKDEAMYASAIRSKCRDSQLTLLLHEAFGGTSISVLFGCCRTEASGPTLNTLDFASVFMRLDNKPLPAETQDTNWELLAQLLMDQLLYVYDAVLSLGHDTLKRPLFLGFENAVKTKNPTLHDANTRVPVDTALAFDRRAWQQRPRPKSATSPTAPVPPARSPGMRRPARILSTGSDSAMLCVDAATTTDAAAFVHVDDTTTEEEVASESTTPSETSSTKRKLMKAKECADALAVQDGDGLPSPAPASAVLPASEDDVDSPALVKTKLDCAVAAPTAAEFITLPCGDGEDFVISSPAPAELIIPASVPPPQESTPECEDLRRRLEASEAHVACLVAKLDAEVQNHSRRAQFESQRAEAKERQLEADLAQRDEVLTQTRAKVAVLERAYLQLETEHRLLKSDRAIEHQVSDEEEMRPPSVVCPSVDAKPATAQVACGDAEADPRRKSRLCVIQ